MLPKLLRNFGVFIDGRGYIGRADEVELPKLTIKTEEYRGGGMDLPVEIDLGMEKLECNITLPEIDPDAVKLLGLYRGDVAVTLRGALRRQGEEAVPCVVKLTGGFKEIDAGSWQAGEKAQTKHAFAANLYTLEIDGEEMVHIDVINMIRRIGGVDQMESIRAAIGA